MTNNCKDLSLLVKEDFESASFFLTCCTWVESGKWQVCGSRAGLIWAHLMTSRFGSLKNVSVRKSRSIIAKIVYLD
jgi:hypothetical protein